MFLLCSTFQLSWLLSPPFSCVPAAHLVIINVEIRIEGLAVDDVDDVQ